MKPVHRHLRFLGYHLYMSRERLRLVPVSNTRGNGLSRRLKELRNRRWNKRHGQCELCQQHADKQSMSLHHILPYSEFPHLAKTPWNLLMLCPRCHFLLHVNLPRQMQLMQRTARQHGINLEQEYNHAAHTRWTDKQQKGGTV